MILTDGEVGVMPAGAVGPVTPPRRVRTTGKGEKQGTSSRRGDLLAPLPALPLPIISPFVSLGEDAIIIDLHQRSLFPPAPSPSLSLLIG